MKKGRFGFVLCFYPLVAFICAILKQPMMCVLVMALAMFLEQNEWAGRQTIQAWLLSMVLALFDNLTAGVSLIQIPFVTGILTTIAAVISSLIYVAVLVFAIIAIVQVVKDREANVPLASSLAYRIYGIVKPRPVPPQYAAPQQPAPVQPNEPSDQQ